MLSPEIRIFITWGLLVPIVIYNIRWAFSAYNADKKLWKLLLHTTAVIGLGLLIVDLGLFCLSIQYDRFHTYRTQFSESKLEVKPGHQEPKPAPAKKKPVRKA
ncbi:MAG: hypothetical protein PHU21_10985 [Elusimicrobia bacterium]|nr:hypothetical protein [Elusimicrobiota bacterium]